MKKVFIIIGLIGFYAVVFRSQINLYTINENDLSDKGSVMGESEVVLENIKPDNNRLPENNDSKNLCPRKVSDNNYDLLSIAGVVIDNESGTELFGKNAEKKVPIASITKLMTALVFLDQNSGWDNIYEIQTDDKVEGGKVYVYPGEKIYVKDLFKLSLIGSANEATIALAKSTGLKEEDFVKAMNKKAEEIGLVDTKFEDIVGLSNANISTAREVAKLAQVAFSKKEIADTLMLNSYSFKTLAGKEKSVFNTNELLDESKNGLVRIVGGKTGYTNAAGYCFVGKFTNSGNNKEVLSVVLGDETKSGRFEDAHDLASWAFASYVWPF